KRIFISKRVIDNRIIFVFQRTQFDNGVMIIDGEIKIAKITHFTKRHTVSTCAVSFFDSNIDSVFFNSIFSDKLICFIKTTALKKLSKLNGKRVNLLNI